jgi:hypothetical protein
MRIQRYWASTQLWRLKTDILLTLEIYSAAKVTFGVMEVQPTLIAIRPVAVDGVRAMVCTGLFHNDHKTSRVASTAESNCL